ncbi:hypothetical protein C0J52_17085 [Blattella germanica]|nr:hypothetical protein C0J52_17085 [Blattella germanica]
MHRLIYIFLSDTHCYRLHLLLLDAHCCRHYLIYNSVSGNWYYILLNYTKHNKQKLITYPKNIFVNNEIQEFVLNCIRVSDKIVEIVR